ncbi:MAG: hypothetical protein ACFFDC_17125 [Promethearchaeota archaeon]
MGEYQEKIKKHFMMLVCSSVSEIDDAKAYRKKYEAAFKIKSKEAFKLVEDHFWSRLYSIIKETRDPDELRKQLESVAQIDVGKVRNHIWQLLLFSVSENRDKNTFRENYEPMFKINPKEAVNLVGDHVWTMIFAKTRKIREPTDLEQELESMVQIDVKQAAEIIKEDNPEKFKFLQAYK